MIIEMAGYKSIGSLVVPRAPNYKFNIESMGKLDLLEFQSCHRVDVKEKAGNKGIFGNSNKTNVDYTPVQGIEDDGNCDVILSGYSIKGKHSFGFISFENDRYKLPALVKCNGSTYNSNGVTICQAKEGLIQQIEFTSEVDLTSHPWIETKDNKLFTYTIQPKENVLIFNKRGDKLFHKLVTLGWASVLIREE